MARKEYGNTSKENQEKLKKDRQEAINAYKESNPFSKQIARYGSNGKMFGNEGGHKPFPKKVEYDNIVIDPPEDLPEEVVAAIVMGAILRPDRLSDHVMTSSSIGSSANVLGFNQCMVINNYISGDNRVGEFEDLIPKARQEAKDAIEEYKKGNKEPAKKMLTDYIDACVLSSRMMAVGNNQKESLSHITNDELQSVLLGAKLLKNNPLNAGSTYGDIEQIRLLNTEKQMDAKIKCADIENEILNNTPVAGSDERKRMVEDILFYSYMRAVSYSEDGNRSLLKSDFNDDMMRKADIEITDIATDPDSEYEQLTSSGEMKKLSDGIFDIHSKHRISDTQMIMQQPDGEEQLKRIYHDAIINSDEYKDMVEAEPDKIYDMINAIRNKNLEEMFPDVKLPNAAEEINKKHETEFNREIQKTEKQATKFINESKVSMGTKKYGINSFSMNDLKNNAKIISDLFDDLDSTDSWYKTSSDQFKNVKKELKEFKKFAQELAKKGKEPTADDLKKYDKMTKNIVELSDKYLDYKKDPKGDYEKNRVSAIKDLKVHILSNRESINNILIQRDEEKDRELQESMSKEYRDNVEKSSAAEKVSNYCNQINNTGAKYNIERRSDVFYGDKYTEADMKASKSDYSVKRSAVQTASIIAMSMENKYTMEELLSPDKFQKEKQEKFDEIFKRMDNKTPENQKYLANIYYNGLQSAIKLKDEYEKQIDYTNPDLVKDEKYIAFGKMSHVIFDSWQEMAHCKDELMELVQKDHPEMKEYADFKDYITEKMGPALTSDSDNLNKVVTDINNDPENYSRIFGSALMHAVQFKVKLDEINKVNEQNRDVTYSERYKDSFIKMEKNDVFISVCGQVLSLGSDISNDKSLSRGVLPKILDGSMLKDMKVKSVSDEEGIKFTGLPTVNQLKADIKYENMEMISPGQIGRMTKDAIKKYDKLSEKASPVHKTYIEKAKDAVNKIKEMIENKTPLVGEQREEAKNCVRDILTEKMVGTLEKAGAKIPENAQKIMAKTVETLPVFEKNTEYLGMGFLGEMAYEDKAIELVKESMVDIQKNLEQTSAQKSVETSLEKDTTVKVQEKEEIKHPVLKSDDVIHM